MRKTVLLLVCLLGVTRTWGHLTDETLYQQLKDLHIQFPKIVLAQARLETGNYTSQLCRTKKNLFGLKGKKGYLSFKSYKECIIYYKTHIQNRYIGGDYYVFLKKIGYAKDPAYITKLKRIVQDLKTLT